MVRKLFALTVGMLVLGLSAGVAEDKKPAKDEKKTEETKLEGKLVCTKCELKETKACGHCLVVTEKVKGKEDTEVKYYLKDKGGKEKYHSKVCSEPKEATVTGKVSDEKDGDKTKKVVAEPKVEFKETK